MSKSPKTSRYLRVRMDFVLQYKDASQSIQMGGLKDFNALMRGIFEAVKSQEGLEAILGGTSIKFSLDHRKRDAAGKLVKP